MIAHACGCATDATTPEQRCTTHRDWWCHSGSVTVTRINEARGEEYALLCPPCYRARLLTVTLDARATPPRRRKGDE